jgi:hypothetical protein
MFCATSPRCDHVWHYSFRVNRHRYRASTETADKHRAGDIEARERSRILDGRHGIRRQADITFAQFADTYLRDHAELHKKTVDRDREIIKVLNRFLGSLCLHQITPIGSNSSWASGWRGSGAGTTRLGCRSRSSRRP